MISYDTETTGLEPFRGSDMFAYSTCDQKGETDVVRIDNPVGRALGARALSSLWDGRMPIVMHNAKFDIEFTEKFLGRSLETQPIHDTYIQSCLLQSGHPTHSLKDLAWELADIPRDDDVAVRRFVGATGTDYSKVPLPLMTRYQRLDAERTMLLHMFWSPKIQADARLRANYEMEMSLVKTTVRMERRGVMVHRERCRNIIEDLTRQIQRVNDRFMTITDQVMGIRFTPSKGQKVATLLYNHMGFPIVARTPSGRPSTDKDAAILPLRESHPNEVLDLILMHRSWTRGVTMLQSYLDFCDGDGIIHPSINTNGARTGRESCSRPNLQNVEKTGVLKNPFPVPARQAFRPRPGFVNFHIDYAGIELRLLVHYSKDRAMVDEIARPGGDPHALAASVFYPPFTAEERREFPTVAEMIKAGFVAHERKSESWNTLRSAAKNANFAIPYGAGATRAGMTLNIPTVLGIRRYAVYQRDFPKLCALSRNLANMARADGMVVTELGRRISVPRQKAYIATNYLIQGTAAGIIKYAQVRVDKLLREATGDEVRLLLPIHDEIVLECPRKRLRDMGDVLRNVRLAMVDFHQFDVPMEIEVSVATRDWADAKEFKI